MPPELVVLHQVEDLPPLADVRVELVLKVLPGAGAILQVQLGGPQTLGGGLTRPVRPVRVPVTWRGQKKTSGQQSCRGHQTVSLESTEVNRDGRLRSQEMKKTDTVLLTNYACLRHVLLGHSCSNIRRGCQDIMIEYECFMSVCRRPQNYREFTTDHLDISPMMFCNLPWMS